MIEVADGVAKNTLLRHAAAANDFHVAMIEVGNTSFDGMGHFLAIAERRQKCSLEAEFRPQVKRLINRIALSELTADIEITHHRTIALALLILANAINPKDKIAAAGNLANGT